MEILPANQYSAALQMPANSWIVEDDPDAARAIKAMLNSIGFSTTIFPTGKTLLEAISTSSALPEIICLDLSLPDIPGLDLLPEIKKRDPKLPVIVITGNTSKHSISKAVELGVYDYLPKSSEQTKFTTIFRRAAEYRKLCSALHKIDDSAFAPPFGIVGVSPAITYVINKIRELAPPDISVLIHGDTGTGKELVAHGLHEASPRKDKQFVVLNCAALPRELLESEIFGHEKGSFTGATHRHIGAFERADGGTLFLDEIGELDISVQAKLLRAIQERAFLRVGGAKEIKSNFRLVVATNRDLMEAVKEGRFRKDLFYRLAVAEITLPPLTSRPEDIGLIAHRFVTSFNAQLGKQICLSQETLNVLSEYSWPGNVRELQNVIQFAMIQCHGDELLPHHLPERIRNSAATDSYHVTNQQVFAQTENLSLEAQEEDSIMRAIRVSQGKISEAASLLGISRATLYRKIKKYGLSTRGYF